jgi:hypothetical protein
MSTFETVFWERNSHEINSHQSNTTVILFRCLFSVNVYRLPRLREGDIYLILRDAIDHTPVSHTWAELTITHTGKHWARSVIPRPVIPEPGWLPPIRRSTEPGQSYLGRSYLSRVGYHPFGGAPSPAGHTWPRPARPHSGEHQARPAWPRPARLHSGEHQARPAIPDLGRLDPIRGSTKPDRPYLTSAGSTPFGGALSPAGHTWSRPARPHSGEHQPRPAIPDLGRLHSIWGSTKPGRPYLTSAGSTPFGEHQARPVIPDLGRLDPIRGSISLDRLDLIRESILSSYIYSDTATRTLFINSGS